MKCLILCVFGFFYQVHAYDLFLHQINSYVPHAEQFMQVLPRVSHENKSWSKKVFSVDADCLPLFKAYPELENTISYIRFASLPTPVEPLSKLNEEYACQMYIKRDDKTGYKDAQGQRFGGNKVRKLEFLLADALAHGKKGIMTFGCAGSNHAAATATYAARLGFDCFCMLKDQPNSWVVQRNLIHMLQAGAEIHYCMTSPLRSLGVLYTGLRYHQLHEQYPYIIPTGGSNPIGILGFVNAAFELKQQIDQNLMPKPDYMYVPVGSSGTIAGLLLGLKAASLDIKIMGIAVEQPDDEGAFEHTIQKLFNETQLLLKQASSTWPTCILKVTDYEIVTDFAGPGYGITTNEAQEAIHTLFRTENIVLDSTYSGKACAAMLHEVKKYDSDKVVLFWLTFDGQTDAIDADYNRLPLALHHYFNI